MDKYIIHACPQRMWYVEEFLVPSLKAQGIEDNRIGVRCDNYNIGNLVKCMEIFERMPEDDAGTWHLQDDIIICRDFKERTDQYTEGIVCGFAWEKDENIDYVGYTDYSHMWWSFPCIRIPNTLAKECAVWFFRVAQNSPRYAIWAASKQYDDYFFQKFLEEHHADEQILQLKPCLVNHIDYLIGGTTLRKVRREEDVRAAWFDDIDLIDELEKKLKERVDG